MQQQTEPQPDGMSALIEALAQLIVRVCSEDAPTIKLPKRPPQRPPRDRAA